VARVVTEIGRDMNRVSQSYSPFFSEIIGNCGYDRALISGMMRTSMMRNYLQQRNYKRIVSLISGVTSVIGVAMYKTEKKER
jgi:hypothetical protein